MTAGLGTIELIVNRDKHEYTLEGQRLLSVTDALALAGFADWFSGAPRLRLEQAKARGSAVHRALELADRGELDWEDLDPALVPYIQGWQAWRFQTGFAVRLVEHAFHHPVYRYAGTLDREGVMGDGSEAVVDFKSATTFGPSARLAAALQLAAYCHAFPKPRRYRRIALQLKPDGSFRAWEFRAVHTGRHFQVFLAALTVAAYKVGGEA